MTTEDRPEDKVYPCEDGWAEGQPGSGLRRQAADRSDPPHLHASSLHHTLPYFASDSWVSVSAAKESSDPLAGLRCTCRVPSRKAHQGAGAQATRLPAKCQQEPRLPLSPTPMCRQRSPSASCQPGPGLQASCMLIGIFCATTPKGLNRISKRGGETDLSQCPSQRSRSRRLLNE